MSLPGGSGLFDPATSSAAAGAKMEEALGQIKERHEKEAKAARQAKESGSKEKKEEKPDLVAPPGAEEDEDDNSSVDSDDSMLNDPELDALREKRMAQLKAQIERKQEQRALGHGEYREIKEEEFLEQVTKSEKVVCHFYHNDFERCKIFDKCVGTKFIKLNAEKAPFFVSKLKIRTLPTLVFFENGVAKGKQLGFHNLGGDEFKTKHLVRTLKENEMIERADLKAFADALDSDSDDEPLDQTAALAKKRAARLAALQASEAY